jgi:hypothetical protein
MDNFSRSRWKALVLVVVGIMLGVALSAPPVTAHIGGGFSHLWRDHIKPRTDARYVQDSTFWLSNSGIGVELDDGEGNDSSICESNETCSLAASCPSGYMPLEGEFGNIDRGSQVVSNLNSGLVQWEVAVANDATPDDYLVAVTCIKR